MKLHYEENSLKSGIYKILNTHTNRIYIGQAARFKERWRDHARSLLNGTHGNRFFRNDFAKCKEELGHDDFVEFYILEVIEGSSKEQRNQREEWWISQYYDKQGQCYNFKQKTETKERSCFSLTPEETKQFIAKQSKDRWDDPSYRQKMREIMSSDSVKEKLSKAQQACWNDPEYRQRQMKSLAESDTGILSSDRLKKRWQEPGFREKMVALLDEKRVKGPRGMQIQYICQNCNQEYSIKKPDPRSKHCFPCSRVLGRERYNEKHGLVPNLQRSCSVCGIGFTLKRSNAKSVNCKKCCLKLCQSRFRSKHRPVSG